jgi:hypothetical protein
VYNVAKLYLLLLQVDCCDVYITFAYFFYVLHVSIVIYCILVFCMLAFLAKFTRIFAFPREVIVI